jgi:hypothetical protein
MEPLYEVVSPVGEDLSTATASGAPAVDSLDGKRIGLVWTVFTNGNILLHAFRDLLAKRFPKASFVEMPPGRNVRWGDHPEQNVGELAREHGLDAAIVTAGC